MRPKTLLPLLAAALMTTYAVPALAQTTEPTAPAATVGDPEKLIDLDLSGPSNVRDYISYLQEVTGLNIVLMNEKGADPQRIEVPPLRLKQMPAATAVELLSDLPGSRLTVEQKNNAFFVIAHAPELIVGPAGPVDENGRTVEQPFTRVYSLEQVLFGNSPVDSATERAKILADKTPQTLKLMEEALSIDGESTAEHALIKLHSGTNTLIVRGTNTQLSTVEAVLKAIGPPAPSDDARAYAAKLQEVEMKADRDRASLAAELQAAREAQARYVNENASLRANLDIAEQKLRALQPANDTKPAAPANQP